MRLAGGTRGPVGFAASPALATLFAATCHTSLSATGAGGRPLTRRRVSR